jgi:adenosylcobyric acid synthase
MVAITDHTSWVPLGIVPWFADAWKLPAEDVMDVASRKGGAIKVVVPRLNRIANFDDLDPLAAQPDVTVEIIEAGRPLPGDADLVLIPGSKSTIADLAHFRAQGWDIDLLAHVRRGGHVLGICGGYQMLGREIADPDGIEGAATRVRGLGLLDVTTVMSAQKTVTQTSATFDATGDPVAGYEIHIGETTGPDCANSWLTTQARQIGAANPNGRVRGCYLHGLFTSDAFRGAFMAGIGAPIQSMEYDADVDATLDALADHLEQHMDLDRLLSLAADVPF